MLAFDDYRQQCKAIHTLFNPSGLGTFMVLQVWTTFSKFDFNLKKLAAKNSQLGSVASHQRIRVCWYHKLWYQVTNHKSEFIQTAHAVPWVERLSPGTPSDPTYSSAASVWWPWGYWSQPAGSPSHWLHRAWSAPGWCPWSPWGGQRKRKVTGSRKSINSRDEHTGDGKDSEGRGCHEGDQPPLS